MHLRIRRRRFGQIAIATFASTALANLTGKTSAQESESTIYGVSLANNSGATNGDRKVARSIDASITPVLALVSSDLASSKDLQTIQLPSVNVVDTTGAVDTVDTADSASRGTKNGGGETASKALYTEPNERITSFTPLANGGFVVVSVASTRNGNFNRIISIDRKSEKPQKAQRASGFQKVNGTIESLAATKENSFIGVISLNEGVPPFDLVNFDFNSAKINTSGELPLLSGNLRLSNLIVAPDNTIYATTLSPQNSPTIVQLDLANKALVTGRGKVIRLAELKYNNKSLENDVLSLAVSKSGQVYALANPTYETENSLFTVNIKSGEMKLLRKFAVEKIAFAR
jgi:hypothetical protein